MAKPKYRPGDRIRALETSLLKRITRGGEYTVRSVDADGDPILTDDDPDDKIGWSLQFEVVSRVNWWKKVGDALRSPFFHGYLVGAGFMALFDAAWHSDVLVAFIRGLLS